MSQQNESRKGAGIALVAGTFDTKASELGYLRDCLAARGIATLTVDVSTSGRESQVDLSAREVAGHHPLGAQAVFTGERATAMPAMALAFEAFVRARADVAGIISAAGSCGTALVTPAMQALPVGVPKVMVSSVAAGNAAPYVGASDVCMMYSVTDVQGINRISEVVLANAAHALAGMIAFRSERGANARPAVGLTMFGVTTPCVQAVVRQLESRYDCLVFHATGTGGRSMERLADSGLLAGVIDVTTTEVADLLVGGIMPATEDRFGAIIRHRIPYVGSCGALDMVNFGARATVPDRFSGRRLYEHNPQITLMRTTPEENAAAGRWIVARLNRMTGPVRFVLPMRGVSAMAAAGGAFFDPEADAALFAAIESGFEPTPQRRLVKVDCAINDPEFAATLVRLFAEIAGDG
jgi:uncharacterized protein (UPF0261 family)